MAIPIFTLPAIAWVLILKLMNLKGLFVTSLTSKRTRSHVKLALKYELITADIRTDLMELVQLKRGRFADSQNNNDNFVKVIIHPSLPNSRRTYWNILGDRSIDVSDLGTLYFYCDEPPEIKCRMLKHLSETFIKLEVDTLKLKDTNGDIVRRTMEALGTTKVDKVNVSMRGTEHARNRNPDNDNIIPTSLESCRNAKELIIEGYPSPRFTYDPTNVEPFNYDYIEFISKWVTMDIFMKLFKDCKKICFEETTFKKDELSDLLKMWVQGSEISFLSLQPKNKNDLKKVLTSMTEATLVARKHFINRNRVKTADCYELQQENGPKALVFGNWEEQQLVLRTDYRLVTNDEGEPMVQFPPLP